MEAPSARFVAVTLFALGWGCNTTQNTGDSSCTAEHHCHLMAGEATCDDGYVWEDPNDPENLACLAVCLPECGERVCGPDPVCGVACGACDAYESCNDAGRCVWGHLSDCTHSAMSVTGSLETSQANINYTGAHVEITAMHKIDADVVDGDGCIAQMEITLALGTGGCELNVVFGWVGENAGGLIELGLSADSFCPGFPDASEGGYSIEAGYGGWWYAGPTVLGARMAAGACLADATIAFPDRAIPLGRDSDGAPLTVNLKGLVLSGDLFSSGNPNQAYIDTYVCSGGFHDCGTGWCLSAGCCSGYHDDGAGGCLASGCAAGFHDGGSGVCVPTGTCSEGYHDGGGGVCVTPATCSQGYHDDCRGVCVAAGCAAGCYDGGGGTCIAGRWSWVSVPSNCYNYSLFSIWGSSASDVWAVGGAYGGAPAVILHWNGSDWSDESLPPDRTPRLRGVWGTGPSNAWAVGAAGTILHWNGSLWSDVSPVEVYDVELEAVWGSGPSDIWAVGEMGTFVHFDGSDWSSVSVPDAHAMTFFSVWGSSATDVWAVGSATLHWNGSAWSYVDRPPGAFSDTLFSVWGSSARDVWAAGFAGTIVHWNGSDWSFTENDSPYTIYGLWGSRPGEVWATKDDYELGLWDGSDWQRLSSSGVNLYDVPLYGIWGSGATDVWAVGEHDGHGVIIHYP